MPVRRAARLRSWLNRDPLVVHWWRGHRSFGDELNRPLVARADADALYAPERLQVQLDFLERQPEVGVVGSAYVKIDGEGRVLNAFQPPPTDAEIRLALRIANCFCNPSVMMRAGALREADGYDESYWTAEDFEPFTRLRGRVGMANLCERLVRYRRHDRSNTRTRGNPGAALSRSITRRELAALVGRPFGDDEARAMLALYHGTEIEPERLPAGGLGLDDFLRAADAAEDPRAVTELRRRLARALLDRVYGLRPSHPAAAGFLLRHAVRCDPRLLRRGAAWRQALALLLGAGRRARPRPPEPPQPAPPARPEGWDPTAPEVWHGRNESEPDRGVDCTSPS